MTKPKKKLARMNEEGKNGPEETPESGRPSADRHSSSSNSVAGVERMKGSRHDPTSSAETKSLKP